MKRSLLITTISCTLLLVGCTQKEEVKPKVRSFNNHIKTYNRGHHRRRGRHHNRRYNIDHINRHSTGDNHTYNYDIKSHDDGVSNGLENIYFDVDEYRITPDNFSIIAHNAKIIKKDIARGATVKVEGNCDASGSDEYNYALGLRRAKSAKEALVNRGIRPSAIDIVSLGESSPECITDDSPECYAKNRRVEFKLLQ